MLPPAIFVNPTMSLGEGREKRGEGREKGEEEREERGGKIGEGGGRVRRKAVTEVLS